VQYKELESLKKTKKKSKVGTTSVSSASTASSGSASSSSSVVSIGSSLSSSSKQSNAMSSPFVPQKKISGQTKISFQKDNLEEVAAKAFACNSLAYRIVDDPYFRKFLDVYARAPTNEKKLITRKSVSSAVRNGGIKVEEKIHNVLVQHPITIGADGWTNTLSEKVINLVGLTGKNAYYLNSVYMDDQKEAGAGEANGPNIAQGIIDEILNLTEKDIFVVALVADNESVMISALDIVKERFPWVILLPCASHSIQLFMKDTRTIEGPLTEATTFLNSLLKFFKYEPYRVQLHDLQKDRTPLRILKPAETRWNGQFISMKRFLELKREVSFVASTVELKWNDMSDACRFYKPFAALTDLAQGDESTIIGVYDKMVEAYVFLDDLEKENGTLTETAKKAKEFLARRWNKHFKPPIYFAQKILTGKPSVDAKSTSQGQQFLCSWGSEYLYERKRQLAKKGGEVKEEKDVDDAKLSIGKIIANQLGQFLAKSGDFSNPYVGLANMRPIEYWGYFKNVVPELSECADAILRVVPTEAACERSFSFQKHVHRPLRNRLSRQNVKAEMMVRMNSHVLDGIYYNPNDCIEL
jgi:uncharacterized protein DUF659/hAT family protein